MPVISSPTRSRYSSNIMSRSASRMRCRITCLAVCAAIRPKSSGVTSSVSIWSSYSLSFSMSISGSGASRISPVSGSTVGWASSVASTSSCSSSSGGIFSSHTMKSPESRSISTFAYGADPGVFLYADSSASSSASISFSDEMFFSAARPRTASRISLDMASVSRDQVRAGDPLIRNGYDAVARGDGHLVLGRAHQLPGHAAPRMTLVDLVAEPYARMASQEACVVMGLGQRSVLARRGDLERGVLGQVAQVQRYALAQAQRDALRVVGEQPQGRPGDLDEQHLDLRLDGRESILDVCLKGGGGHDLLHRDAS